MRTLTLLSAPVLAGALALTTALPALAAVEKVASVDVTVDLAAIQNAQAAAYWGNLEKDIEAAIGARITDRLADDGAAILVDIREVELSSAFERQLNLADAVLVGQVNVNDKTDNANFDAYELSVSLETAQIVLPDGVVPMFASTDTTETYRRLVDTFADAVVANLN